MKCLYHWEEEPGRKCNSRAVKEYGDEHQPYCRSHAVRMGLVNDSFRIEKCKSSLSITHAETKRKGQVVGAKLKEIVGLDVLLGIDPKGFILAVEYPLICTANLLPMTENGNQKYGLMMWLVADQESRVPGTIEEVAMFLGLPIEEVQGWMRSREFIDIFQLQRKRFMQTRGRLVDVVLLTKCMAGERWAVELFYERFCGDTEIPKLGRPKNMPKRTMTLTASEYDAPILPTPSQARDVRLKSSAARELAGIMASRMIEGSATPIENIKEDEDGNLE